MSSQALEYVRPLAMLLTPTEQKVVEALATLAQAPDHLIDAPMALIARTAGVSKSTLQRVLAVLTVRPLPDTDTPLLLRIAQHYADGGQGTNLLCFPALGVPMVMQFSVNWQRNQARYQAVAAQQQRILRSIEAHRHAVPRHSTAASS